MKTPLRPQPAIPARCHKQILANIQEVQKKNELNVSDKLDGMKFFYWYGNRNRKTYAYLRIIYELNKKYGFKKFVILEPSIAIRES